MQRQTCVNNLPKVVTHLCPSGNWTHDLLIASPNALPLRHCATVGLSIYPWQISPIYTFIPYPDSILMTTTAGSNERLGSRSALHTLENMSNTFDIHRVRKKRGHAIFNYNSRILWSISTIFVPLETGINIPQSHVIYLLKIFMTS